MVDAHPDSESPTGCMVVAGTTTCDGAGVPESIRRALHQALRLGGDAIEARLLRAQREGQLADGVDVAALATYFNTVLAGISIQVQGRACRQVLGEVVTVAMSAWRPRARASA